MKVQDEKREVTSLESVSEIDQYLAAQQLIAEISDQFARNKSMLESWFIASSVEEFKVMGIFLFFLMVKYTHLLTL